MAELADVPDLGSGGYTVWVRVPLSALGNLTVIHPWDSFIHSKHTW